MSKNTEELDSILDTLDEYNVAYRMSDIRQLLKPKLLQWKDSRVIEGRIDELYRLISPDSRDTYRGEIIKRLHDLEAQLTRKEK